MLNAQILSSCEKGTLLRRVSSQSAMELHCLLENEKEIRILIKGETWTFCALLRQILFTFEETKIAGFTIESPVAKDSEFYLSLKEGTGFKTDNEGRTYFLWTDAKLRKLWSKNGFNVIYFSKNESVLNSKDVWLGYVLKKSEL